MLGQCSSIVLALATSTNNLTVTINCGIQTTSIGAIFEKVFVEQLIIFVHNYFVVVLSGILKVIFS